LSATGSTAVPVRAEPVRTRGWVDSAVAAVLFALAAALNLASAAAVDVQQWLSAEEVSVSILDVVAVPARFQPTEYATNFGGHVHFWVFSYLHPSLDLFYGRDGKAVAMALLAPLAYLTLRRRLSCGRATSALGAAVVVLLPGVSALAWLATENGLEALWGMATLLLVTSRRGWWVLAPITAGISVSTYGAGLAWAGAAALVAVVRLVRSPRRLRETLGVLGATVVGAAIVCFPLVWWEGGGRIVIGGGSFDTAEPVEALDSLLQELTVRGDSYYYFTAAPALGSLWLAVVLGVCLILATVWRPRLWPWTGTLVLTVVLYAVSGGVLGVRRTIAIPIVAGLALAVAVDQLVRRRPAAVRALAVAVVAGAALVPVGLHHLEERQVWVSGRYQLPRDFAFALANGRTMVEEVAALTDRLNSGRATYKQVAEEREGERALAMVWLLAERNGRDLTGLATPAQIADLAREGPRCTRDCHPVPGRP
jgi:hypothetical protein